MESLYAIYLCQNDIIWNKSQREKCREGEAPQNDRIRILIDGLDPFLCSETHKTHRKDRFLPISFDQVHYFQFGFGHFVELLLLYTFPFGTYSKQYHSDRDKWHIKIQKITKKQ